jgi:hypothetical protein
MFPVLVYACHTDGKSIAGGFRPAGSLRFGAADWPDIFSF